MMEILKEYRKRLDKIDSKILEGLSERVFVVEEVGEAKLHDSALKFRDFVREEEILQKIMKKGEAYQLDPVHIRKLFSEIIEYSVRIQEQKLYKTEVEEGPGVAYHGCKGSYSYLAAKTHFGSFKDFSSAEKGASFKSYDTLEGMIQALADGKQDFAILPLENTTAGSINESYDLLGKYDLKIVGEEILTVNHCLMTLEKIPLHRVKRVLSHPQALLQCSKFLENLDCSKEAFSNTAKAAEYIHKLQDPSLAAIASPEAAENYGLHVIEHNITNQVKNYTRLIIVSREERFYDQRVPCKTSLVFTLGHKKGALIRALQVFEKYELNLTKIESRPKVNSPWEYFFYVDFEGNGQDPHVKKMLIELTGETTHMKNLGSYPAPLERKVKGN
ncbi:MAG: prephenate dehydratase [Halobacteriovoraceae bacterium]|nr:prephenate dehydratase [Halobacteriovoraceae bacterium]